MRKLTLVHARGRRATSASRTASRGLGPRGSGKLVVVDVAAHGLDIERLGVLVVVYADHDQAAAAPRRNGSGPARWRCRTGSSEP
jgi:hypothetical protein